VLESLKACRQTDDLNSFLKNVVMVIKTAVFEKSSSKISECPSGIRPEFAFIGRSNVGKSSLINMLTGRNRLAKISVSPGKTRLINHFLINNQWFLVDLPGYGYAKVSKSMKAEFGKLIENYILKSENLACLFILVDGRLEPQEIDMEFINWCGTNEVPLVLVFTKTDKLSMRDFNENKKKIEKKLTETWDEQPASFVSSSVKKTGRDEILDFIHKVIHDKKTNN
jgi:GTP-binding protein